MIETRTFWGLVAARAADSPDAFMALDESGRVLTFGEFAALAETMAAGLYERGVRTGTPVTWILPTSLDALALMAALARLGAVQNPVLPIYRRREVEFCLRQTGAQWLIVPSVYRGFDHAGLARELCEEIPALHMLVADPAEGPLPTSDPKRLPPPPPDDDDREVRWIYYTSGTTSDPKGARHSDYSVLAPSYGLARAMDLRPTDRIGMVFPVTHLGGANSLIAGLSHGAGHLVVEQFDPPTTVPFLGRHGVTHAGAGTVFHHAYLTAQREHGVPGEKVFPDIRAFQGGGAPKPPQLHYDLAEEMGGAGILSAYGMTECAIICIARLDDAPEKLAHTEGRTNVSGTEIRVLRGDGTAADPGEEGELVVRAPQLCQGYVDDALDAAAWDADGFFRTGDLGTVDPDGYVAITGRVKDVIIRKGENISALEIENLLVAHPKVADVSVVGLADPERGERACAVVICRDQGDPLSFDEMTRFLQDTELMRQKIPEQLELVAELPRNASGKVVKRDLVKRFGATPVPAR